MPSKRLWRVTAISFSPVAYLSARDGSGAVTVVAADVGADIHLDDIALADDMRLGRNAVNDPHR